MAQTIIEGIVFLQMNILTQILFWILLLFVSNYFIFFSSSHFPLLESYQIHWILCQVHTNVCVNHPNTMMTLTFGYHLSSKMNQQHIEQFTFQLTLFTIHKMLEQFHRAQYKFTHFARIGNIMFGWIFISFYHINDCYTKLSSFIFLK